MISDRDFYDELMLMKKLMDDLGVAYRLEDWYDYGRVILVMFKCMRKLSTLGRLRVSYEQEFGPEGDRE